MLKALPSAIEEDALLQEGHETNSHHNVPRSRGGASNFFNEKPVDPERHSLWHDFADNKLPTEAIRMAAISGIGRNGLTVDPHRLETIF